MADKPQDRPRIVVAGAGAIGCYVGGLLASAGHDVTLLVRSRIAAAIRDHGLTLTDLEGLDVKVSANNLALSEDIACLSQADIVLVTVKSRDTAEIAQSIAVHAPDHATVLSFQNGVSNAGVLRAALTGHDVRAGMVPFNVVPTGPGGYHRATDGHIVMEAGAGALGHRLSVRGLEIAESDDIQNVQWGKFLLNLNNALNALSGQPLRTQLSDRAWRKLMADQWDEALTVITAAGHQPVSSTPVSVRMIPRILRLPTFLFTRVASAMLKIDPSARTSMAYDLMEGRPTEIDALQGEIARIGGQLGIPTPLNETIAEAVRKAEADGPGTPDVGVSSLRAAIAKTR